MSINALHVHDSGVTETNCAICATYALPGIDIIDWPLTAAGVAQLERAFGYGSGLPKSRRGRTDHRRPAGRRDAVRPPRP